MKIVKTKYKIWGGFSLLIFLNVMWFFLFRVAVLKIYRNLSMHEEWETGSIVVVSFIILMELIFIALFMSECKYMKVKPDKIIFINPILPFLRKTRYFSEYDYKQIVEEEARGGPHEALWLIKNRKLKVRISSFYYSNYSELKESIKIKDEGRLLINPFKQFGCILGMKI